jgi:hypothetical protein
VLCRLGAEALQLSQRSPLAPPSLGAPLSSTPSPSLEDDSIVYPRRRTPKREETQSNRGGRSTCCTGAAESLERAGAPSLSLLGWCRVRRVVEVSSSSSLNSEDGCSVSATAKVGENTAEKNGVDSSCLVSASTSCVALTRTGVSIAMRTHAGLIHAAALGPARLGREARRAQRNHATCLSAECSPSGRSAHSSVGAYLVPPSSYPGATGVSMTRVGWLYTHTRVGRAQGA